MPFHVYILYSEEADRHYIGQTSDICGRIAQHIAGNTQFTSGCGDWQIVFLQTVATAAEALSMERKIKDAKSRKSIRRYIRRYIVDSRNELSQSMPLKKWICP